jgi:hypothetical protein
MTDGADLIVRASLASVTVAGGERLIGFAEGDEDEPYALFTQATRGGPVRLEVNDALFAAEDAVRALVVGDGALNIEIDPPHRAAFGFARSVAILVGPRTEGLPAALVALRRMLGARIRDRTPEPGDDAPA